MLFAHPTRCFAAALLGDSLHGAQEGAVFVMASDWSDSDRTEALEPFALQDVAVLALANEGESSDFMELHFARRLPDHDRILLQMLGPVLSRSWRDRVPGLAAALLSRNPFPVRTDAPAEQANILSASNPAGLTRSEFRLCLLVQEGGLPDQVAATLGITKSTFRSHLRAIYLKTGVTGHVELVHLLHQSRSAGAPAPERRGRLA